MKNIYLPLLLFILNSVSGSRIWFPTDAGVIDVTKPPYSAIPNDGKDDTIAIQNAFNAHVSGNHIFYFPAGVYDISDTLMNRPAGDPLANSYACLELRGSMKRNILIGESEAETILRLSDQVSSDFNAALIWFGKTPAQRFRNGLRNLTLSIGKGHPNANGVYFNASNQGGIRNVTIRSEDPSGSGNVGLDMAHTDEIGPLLVQHITILGFRRGIRCAWQTASQTFEHIELKGQTEYGWTNGFSQSIFVRGLHFEGPVTALHNGPTVKGDPGQGRFLLVDAKLKYTGNGNPPTAVRNQKWAFLRNVQSDGFQAVVSRELDHGRGNPTVKESPLVEFIANGSETGRKGRAFQLFDSPNRSLNLPIVEPPQIPWETDPLLWKSPMDFPIGMSGMPNDDYDDTPSLQAAMDSGATTVYLPRGRWLLQGELILRKNVRHFVGCEAWLNPSKGKSGEVLLGDGASTSVLIEGIEAGRTRFSHQSNRTLHLRHLLGGSYLATSNSEAGKLFLTDVTLGPLTLAPGQHAWARQLNIEGNTDEDPLHEAKVMNNGGTLWILGMKTEDSGTVIKTIGGGKTELLGHLHVGATGNSPCFVTIESSFSAAITSANAFPVAALETRNGETRSAPHFNHADLYSAFAEVSE